MALDPKLVHEALGTVQDPELGRDLVSLGMVKSVEVEGERVAITVELTTPACPLKDRIRADIEEAVRRAAEAAGANPLQIEVTFTADVRKGRPARNQESPLPDVRHVIAVGAGKGGVGKSTIAVSLAVGLARLGARAGLLDGDIYGPSMPAMLGLDDLTGEVRGNTLVPFEVHGIRAMTIGKLVDPERALIWRGPMAHNAFRQLALQTDWGELDYLIVDLPPGTGDVPLTLAQLLPLTGAVVVCTPQRVAIDDARRAVRMFQQLEVDVLGIVENMSYFIAEDGSEHDLFGRGGAESLAGSMNVPFLGALPVWPELRVNCDHGRPLENWRNERLGEQLDAICRNLAGQVSVATMAGKIVQPSLSVE